MLSRRLLLALFLLSAPLRAGENVWTPIGPEGGTVTALAFAANGRTVYAGTPTAGVFKSVNTGRTWLPTDSAVRGAVRGLATDPRRTATVYAATSKGIWKSDDAGRSWRNLTRGLPVGTVEALTVVVDPLSRNGVYCSLDSDRGKPPRVFRSMDGGASWELATTGLPRQGIVRALAVHPSRRGVLFAAMPNGVFRSRDFGRSWQPSGLGGSDVFDVDIDPLQPSHVYGVRVDPEERIPEVLVSEDDGRSWVPSESRIEGGYEGRIVTDPLSPGTAYLFSDYLHDYVSIHKTTDGGRHWTPIPVSVELYGAIHALAHHPRQPGMLLMGREDDFDRAIFRTTDGGASWSATGSGIRGLEFFQVLADPRTPGLLYAASPRGNLWKTTDAGRSWRYLPSPSFRLVLDPHPPTTLYSVDFQLKKSIDGGEQWREILNTPFFTALTLAPTAPDTLYGGDLNGIYKSTDAGESWGALSAMEGFETTRLVVAPSSASTVYANVIDSGEELVFESMYRSTDAGETWTELLELPWVYSLHDFVVHPDVPDRALAAFSWVRITGGVYRTSDGGLTWQISLLSRKEPPALSLLFDPQRPYRVYTGSTGEIYMSRDSGITWTLLGTGLPDAEVVDLEIDPFDPDTIYAATNGGLYSLTYHPRR